jgi:hypothetical protein
MANFSRDAELLKWEPDVFRLCRFGHQKLGGGSAGATSAHSATFTDATAGDFVNAGVTQGHVLYLSKSGAYDDYFGVASRTSATQLVLDAPAGIFTAQSGIAWSVHTFDAQHEEVHFELCERFDLAETLEHGESDVFDARVLRRASVFRVLEIVFRAQATGEQDLFWKKAERYRALYERALAAVQLRFDTNRDGTPDETANAHSVNLRVEQAGDSWPT